MTVKHKNAIAASLSLIFLVSFACCGTAGANTGNETSGSTQLVSNKKWAGDYDALVQRRFIRVLIPYSKTFYFLDGATQRGASYEMVKAFEKQINKKLKTRHLKVHALFIPTSRDRLIPDLAEGLGDMAVGNLTVTPKRSEQVDFCDPLGKGVSEILVTGPDSPAVATLSDLVGKEIHVRKSSSYYSSLEKANKKLKSRGKKRIKIIPADENLEDEDLLEMLNAGLIPMMVIDSHKANFWVQVFDRIKLHPDIRFRENGSIAWAVQKGTPKLKAQVNAFVKSHKIGTLMGNMLFQRYLKHNKYVKNSLAAKDRRRFEKTAPFFKKYAGMYEFDWLMLAALAYQESGIDQSKRSPVGAVGVMQILPSTAGDRNVNIKDIYKIEPNIHAGTKYLRFLSDQYFSDSEINSLNRMLLSFAAYNAGPGRVSGLRRQAKKMGLDPNVWFRNVEIVAAKRIGRETVQYVSNIFKYYTAYRLIAEQKGDI